MHNFMKMTSQEFINALKTKPKDDHLLLTEKLKECHELIQDVIQVLENQQGPELFNSICGQLFVIYKDQNLSDSNVACLQFAPSLIWAYYSLMGKKLNESSGKVEALLLAIYNQNVRKHKDAAGMNSFRIPSIFRTSIFHEPVSFTSTSILTENALSQHEKADEPILFKGPTKHLDHIPAGLRCAVLNSVLQEFNCNLTLYTRPILISLCNMIVRLSSCGYKLSDIEYPCLNEDLLGELETHPKVRLSSNVVQQMVTALQFIAYNGLYNEAKPAIQCLRRHCQYSLSFAGVLNTNALLNLLELSIDETDQNKEHVNPTKCMFRGRGKSSTIGGSNRAIFSRSMSIEHNLLNEGKTAQLQQQSPRQSEPQEPKDLLSQPPQIILNTDSPFSDTDTTDGKPNSKVLGADTSTPRNVVIKTTTHSINSVETTIDNGTFVVISTNKKLTYDGANVSYDDFSDERTPSSGNRTLASIDDEDFDCDKIPLILNQSSDVRSRVPDNDSNNSADLDRCNSGSQLTSHHGSRESNQTKQSVHEDTKM